MDLSYEETMRRIAQYEKEDPDWNCCKVKSKPYNVHVYQGENQIIVVPSIKSIGYYYVEMAWFRQIADTKDAQMIGETVLEALEHIERSPVDARTEAERNQDSVELHATTCKSYRAFNRKYMMTGVRYYEDGTYVVSQTSRLSGNNGYGGEDDSLIKLPSTATAMNIGSAIVQSFTEMELVNKSSKKKSRTRPRTTIETLSAGKISFETLQGDHYMDEQDYGVAEIYQGYSYRKESSEESVADLYFSIASELDCDMTPDNIRREYGELYGEDAQITITEVSHPVFRKRIEVTSEEIHHITYVRQVDETELLACQLELRLKPAGKRIYAKVLKDFEKMVASTKFE